MVTSTLVVKVIKFLTIFFPILSLKWKSGVCLFGKTSLKVCIEIQPFRKYILLLCFMNIFHTFSKFSVSQNSWFLAIENDKTAPHIIVYIQKWPGSWWKVETDVYVCREKHQGCHRKSIRIHKMRIYKNITTFCDWSI